MKKQLLCVLLIAALVLSLAACGKAPEAKTLENGDMHLTIPAEYADLVIADTGEEGELFTVSEKASVEAAKKQGYEEHNGLGWLFAISCVTEEQAQQLRCGDMSGSEIFAKDSDGNYYLYNHPTDVRINREGEITEADMRQWSGLNEWAGSVMCGAFIEENPKLEAFTCGNTDLDIVFARIAFQSDVNYTISTLDYGPLDPKSVDAKPFLDKLMNGVLYDYADTQAPDGEYVVLSFPDEGVRYNFFRGDENMIRRVYDDGTETLYRATFTDGKTTSTAVMQEWYDAIAAQRDIDLLGYTPDSLLGRWAEKIAGRGLITVEKGENEGDYQIEIVWSRSAAEQAVWEMTARPVASNTLRYADGKHVVRTYSADGSFTEVTQYVNGTGVFTLNSANEIMWQDDIDHAGDDTVFISVD